MKIIKSKILSAIALGIVSFGMFSFVTKPVNAQTDNSEISDRGEVRSEENTSFIVIGGPEIVYIIYIGNPGRFFGNESSFVEYPNNVLD